MIISRRSLLASGAALAVQPATRLAAAKKKLAGLRLGVTDWNLRKTGNIEAIALAKTLGFEGLEVSLGRKPIDNKLPLDNPALQARYLAEAKKHKLALAGTCLDILHVNYLKSDKLGQKWLADAIPITKKLKARVILLPFFGKGALQTPQEMDYVGDLLRELAPEAQKARVLLGLENTISAADNVRIMDRAKSPAVRPFVHDGRHAGDQRAVDDVAVAHHPADVAGGKVGLARLAQEDVLHARGQRHGIAAGVALHTLGLAGGAAGVERVARVGGVQPLAGHHGIQVLLRARPRSPRRGRPHRASAPGRGRPSAPCAACASASVMASSSRPLYGTTLPPRLPASALTITVGLASSMRLARLTLAKPPNTTEWIAPMRAQASIANAASAIIGM